MLVTNNDSIKEVILFPQMKSEVDTTDSSLPHAHEDN